MKNLTISILILLFSLASFASSNLIDWSSETGIKRLSESKHKIDFFTLANNFRAQPNGVVCGPTTGAIILNSLRLSKKDERLPFIHFDENLKKNIPKKWDPRIKMYTPENFIGSVTKQVKTNAQIFGEPIDGKKDFGLQIRQFDKMLTAHGAKTQLRVVNNDFDINKMRKEMINNLKTKNDYVVINYKRKALGQKGGGHISPIGAYHKSTDSFLILDVTANKHNWIWAPAKSVFQAMKTLDTIENRGYILISE